MVSFPILDEKLVYKIIKPMLVENIVTHILLLEITIAQCSPVDHTFPEVIQLPILLDIDDDDNLKEELTGGCQAKFCSLSLSDKW